jgi:16S rRNA (uracil1498-N3)-methyltransferase
MAAPVALQTMARDPAPAPAAAATRLFHGGPLAAGQAVELDDQAAHHALRVLRLRTGDPVELFNGDGRRYRGRLAEARGRAAIAEIHEVLDAGTESPLWLGLAQAVPSGDKMDWVVEKAVELGVACIQPVLSSRCVTRLDAARAARRLEHWQRIVVAACMQCGRDRLPRVLPVRAFGDWVRQPPEPLAEDSGALRLMVSPRAVHGLASVGAPTGAPAVWLLAGPEGGLDDGEEALAAGAGWQPIRLGPRVLRTETAGLAALAALQARLGDF